MAAGASPASEISRLGKLVGYQVLDTPPERAFDEITEIAAKLIGVPISLVSLIDRDRQWFKARYGLGATETPPGAARPAPGAHDVAPRLSRQRKSRSPQLPSAMD